MVTDLIKVFNRGIVFIRFFSVNLSSTNKSKVSLYSSYSSYSFHQVNKQNLKPNYFSLVGEGHETYK